MALEYNLQDFVDTLREYLYGLFPYENDEINEKKHPNRPLHIRDIAFMWLPTTNSGSKMITFDIGSDYAEQYYPYYHILQDAQVIRKRGRGTEKSKGSQALISDLGKRDYGRIDFNGKTYTKEYARNVRGERKRIIEKSTRYTYSNGERVKINASANYYQNVHYRYIDKILDYSVPFIAQAYGLKALRKQDTGLELEFQEQQQQDQQDTILNAMYSFE